MNFLDSTDMLINIFEMWKMKNANFLLKSFEIINRITSSTKVFKLKNKK